VSGSLSGFVLACLACLGLVLAVCCLVIAARERLEREALFDLPRQRLERLRWLEAHIEEFGYLDQELETRPDKYSLRSCAAEEGC